MTFDTVIPIVIINSGKTLLNLKERSGTTRNNKTPRLHPPALLKQQTTGEIAHLVGPFRYLSLVLHQFELLEHCGILCSAQREAIRFRVKEGAISR